MPALGAAKPPNRFTSVLLPEPLAPMTPMRAKPRTAKDTSESASCSGYEKRTPSSSSVASSLHAATSRGAAASSAAPRASSSADEMIP